MEQPEEISREAFDEVHAFVHNKMAEKYATIVDEMHEYFIDCVHDFLADKAETLYNAIMADIKNECHWTTRHSHTNKVIDRLKTNVDEILIEARKSAEAEMD